jgi:regulation of enolase protein 1 (concanavalin A-like superfamily)
MKNLLLLLLITSMSNLLPAKDNITVVSPKSMKQTDIGNPTTTGKVNTTENGFEITAGGADIWGTRDEFHFSYQTVKGDFDISVQILSLSTTNLYTKAGIMARTDLNDNSQHVYFQVFPDNSPRNHNNGGCEFQYRAIEGGEMKAIYPDINTAGTRFNVAFPNTWIRLKRSGNEFQSYFSSDNKSWTLYSTYTLNMPEELFVGVAVTSHDSNKTTTAQFSSIKLKK